MANLSISGVQTQKLPFTVKLIKDIIKIFKEWLLERPLKGSQTSS